MDVTCVFCFSPRSKSAHAAARRLRQAQRVEHVVRAMSSYSSGRPRAHAARPREPAIGPALRAGRRAGLASAARLLGALARALGRGQGGELLVRVRVRVRLTTLALALTLTLTLTLTLSLTLTAAPDLGGGGVDADGVVEVGLGRAQLHAESEALRDLTWLGLGIG